MVSLSSGWCEQCRREFLEPFQKRKAVLRDVFWICFTRLCFQRSTSMNVQMRVAEVNHSIIVNRSPRWRRSADRSCLRFTCAVHSCNIWFILRVITVVGKIFSRGSRKEFSRGCKSGEISFYPLETKNTTFFSKTLIGNCHISKPRGKLPWSLPTPMHVLWLLICAGCAFPPATASILSEIAGNRPSGSKSYNASCLKHNIWFSISWKKFVSNRKRAAISLMSKRCLFSAVNTLWAAPLAWRSCCARNQVKLKKPAATASVVCLLVLVTAVLRLGRMRSATPPTFDPIYLNSAGARSLLHVFSVAEKQK